MSEGLRESIPVRTEISIPLPDAPKQRDRRWLVFGIVSAVVFMAAVDQTIVATALAAIQQDLHARVNWSGWTITAYSLGQVVAMPVAGRISDQHGRKKVLLSAIVLFITASLCCGLAGNIYLLVVFRALQGFGGGAFMPSATGVISEQFGRDRDRAIGLQTSIFPIGGVIGPVLGGVLVSYWSWRDVFLVNVPIGIALLVLAARFVPRTSRTTVARTDLRGVMLLAVFLTSAMYGITTLGGIGSGPTHPVFLVSEAVAVATLCLFARHIRRHSAPVIPLELLRRKGFGTINLINLLFGATTLGFSALVPLYAEQRFGIHTLGAGTLLSGRAVGMTLFAALVTLALRRIGHRLPMLVGQSVVVAGLIVTSLSPHGLSPYGWLALGTGISGIGMGIVVPAANNANLHLAPDQIAAIAGLRGTFRQCGSITAISVTTAILARSQDPGLAQAHVFAVFAVLLLCCTPLLLLVPDHRGTW